MDIMDLSILKDINGCIIIKQYWIKEKGTSISKNVSYKNYPFKKIVYMYMYVRLHLQVSVLQLCHWYLFLI